MSDTHATTVQSPALGALDDIAHGFGTRMGGVSKGIYATLNCGIGSKDDPESVVENRSRLAAAIGAQTAMLVTPYQTHSAIAVVADEPWERGNAPKADGVVTRTPGLAIAVTTADCVPVLFCEPEMRIVGAAHAGWRGAFGGILEATLDTMEKLGADRDKIIASIGPAISQPVYEVGEDFRDDFLARDSANDRFFARPAPDSKPHFDLTGYVAERLESAGAGMVENLALCTYRDETRFFSYRRTCHAGEEDYGRQISAIVISR